MILLLFGMLFVFIGFGFSIWAAMGVSGLIYIFIQGDVSFRIVVSQMVGGINSTTLIAIPFFILAGNLMNHSGITKKLADFGDFFVGRFRAGLAYVSIVVSVIMAGVSGSAVADASSVSSVLHPIMRERGYDDTFSASINASSAVIGPIIPPSIPMILIGAISGISIGRLFLGGVIPGLLMGAFLWIASTVLSRRRGYPAVKSEMTFKRFAFVLKDTFLAVLAPAFVISGVVFGFVTLVEVAALSIVYILFLSLVVYRSLTWKKLLEVFKDTAIFSSSIMIIFAVVGLYQYIVALEQLGDQLFALVEALSLGKFGFLAFTTVFFLLMGCILDAVPVMLLFFPVLLPIAIQLGIDPTHFGVIVVLNLMIGLLTPPIGALLFIQTKIAGLQFNELVRAIWPFTLALIAVLLLITYVPILVLWVPNLVF
ncbi:MAG: TRAP transporter large permease [Spirochaetales bacterium]|nr:TRAP transporter large permease [Spirochaetales bacterium]